MRDEHDNKEHSNLIFKKEWNIQNIDKKMKVRKCRVTYNK